MSEQSSQKELSSLPPDKDPKDLHFWTNQEVALLLDHLSLQQKMIEDLQERLEGAAKVLAPWMELVNSKLFPTG